MAAHAMDEAPALESPFEEALRLAASQLRLAGEAHRREIAVLRQHFQAAEHERPVDQPLTTVPETSSDGEAGSEEESCPASPWSSARCSVSSVNVSVRGDSGPILPVPQPPCSRRQSDPCATLGPFRPHPVRKTRTSDLHPLKRPSGELSAVLPAAHDPDGASKPMTPVRSSDSRRTSLLVPGERPRGSMHNVELPGCLDAGAEAPVCAKATASTDADGMAERLSSLHTDHYHSVNSYQEAGAELSTGSRGHRGSRARLTPSMLLASWECDETSMDGQATTWCLEAGMVAEASGSRALTGEHESPLSFQLLKNLLRCRVIHPQSNPRLLFDIVALFVMIYDLATIPVYMAFDLEGDPVMKVLEWVTVLFWSFDMALSFNTGFNTSDGCLIMRRGQVVRNYLCTWFGPDICVLAPEYLLLMDRTASDGAAEALRTMRFVRVLRLLRLIKFDKILRDLMARINSNPFLLGLAILRHIFCLSLVIHVVACIWYGLGTKEGGWVETHGLAHASLWHSYLVSLHWSLTQFHGSTNVNPVNELERLLAVVVLLMALILFSSFLSSITNLMMQLSSLRHERTVHLQALYCFLEDHSISLELSVRVKKYVESRATLQQKEHDVELLKVLPKQLMMDLHDEARSPPLTSNAFMGQLREKHPRVVRQLCHEAVQQACFQREDAIFNKGDCTQRMYFIEWGHARYCLGGKPRNHRVTDRCTRGGSTSGSIGNESMETNNSMSWVRRAFNFGHKATLSDLVSASTTDSNAEESRSSNGQDLGRGRSLAEASLWTRWEHRGDLLAVSNSSVLMLSVKEFQHVVEAYESARAECVMYGRAFVDAMRHQHPLSDLMDFRVTRRSSRQSQVFR